MSEMVDACVPGWSVEVSPPAAEGAPSMVKVKSGGSSEAQFSGSYPVQMVHGVTYPGWCSEQRRDKLQRELKLRSDDVLVVSYPKCGTTWAEQCILLLQNRGDTSKMDPAAKNVYVPSNREAPGKIWPEACVEQNPVVHTKLVTGNEFVPITMDEFDDAPSPRTLKSHAPPHLLLTGGPTMRPDQAPGMASLPLGVKVLVVTRNPLDACVSSYYHAWNPFESGWPFDAWAAAWLSGNVPHGCWFDWVKSWKAVAEDPQFADRILWVQYEDLKADPVGTVRRVASFLDPALAADEALVASVSNASSFDAMKEQAAAGAGKVAKAAAAAAAAAEETGSGAGKPAAAATAGHSHLRKGVAGDWRNHFTAEVRAAFDRKYQQKLAGTGIEFSLGAGEGVMRA